MREEKNKRELKKEKERKKEENDYEIIQRANQGRREKGR